MARQIAPSAYETEKVNLAHQPAYSFGTRPADKIKSDIPGRLEIFLSLAWIHFQFSLNLHGINSTWYIFT